ncbi:helix-turn-helix domain-containing protein [Salinibaculum salinum]|uniref:helix-turn-helix domain-containing protein n=1 Tax=Salinibaculum salinum TaxID=3131996 RepID=UPI0030ED464F
MPQAKLRLDIPDEVWIGDITRRYPDASVRILAALSDEDAGVGLAEITASNPREVVRDIEDAEDVTSVDMLKYSDGDVLVQFETTMPLLLLPARDSGVPLEMPFEIQDGTATWEVTAPSERLSELGTQLESFGISFTVDYVQQRLNEEQLVTDRQRRVVQTALEEGYYDTPRDSSLTELADSLDIAKSTASETLHRAEEKIIKHYAEQFQWASSEE